MKESILRTLRDLRSYALSRGKEASFLYREERSSLLRLAGSAVSLNTEERLARLDVSVYEGKRRASFGLLADLGRAEDLRKAVDEAAEMVRHTQPLSYTPTVPCLPESFEDESCFDPVLAGMDGEGKLSWYREAAGGLETPEVKLAGIFSSGDTVTAAVSTRSEHHQFFRTSDAQVTAVLSHDALHWEVRAAQSAQRSSDLDPASVRRDLAFLLERYRGDAPVSVPLGRYDVVFGSAAVADLLQFLNGVGFNGGSLKRGTSFLSEDQAGKRVFSPLFTLLDDPGRRETFPFRRDLMGMERETRTLFGDGVFRGFLWSQDDADEFGAAATGHTVPHKSLVLRGGTGEASTLEELAAMPRETDLLYVPYLHYMNVVNPSKGVVTGSSRFGALLLKKDGTVRVPYNVRLTQSLRDVFGDGVQWLSRDTVAYNVSSTYGARNPTALVVPRFLRVNGLEISHSNASY